MKNNALDVESSKPSKLKKFVGTKAKKTDLLINDGIQVSVLSDKEDLDYVDNVTDVDQDDKNGSINQDQGSSDDTMDSQIEGGIGLGATSASLNDEEQILNNPYLKKLLEKMLDERIKNAKGKGESSTSELLTSRTPNQTTKESGEKGKQSQQKSKNNLIKSPSDTTIYAPALKCTPLRNKEVLVLSSMGTPLPQTAVNLVRQVNMAKASQTVENADLMVNISNFVDQMRLEHEEVETQDLDGQQQYCSKLKSKINAPGLEEAQKRMDQALIQEIQGINRKSARYATFCYSRAIWSKY